MKCFQLIHAAGKAYLVRESRFPSDNPSFAVGTEPKPPPAARCVLWKNNFREISSVVHLDMTLLCSQGFTGGFFLFAETEGFKIDTMGTYHGMTLKSVTVSGKSLLNSFYRHYCKHICSICLELEISCLGSGRSLKLSNNGWKFQDKMCFVWSACSRGLFPRGLFVWSKKVCWEGFSRCSLFLLYWTYPDFCWLGVWKGHKWS